MARKRDGAALGRGLGEESISANCPFYAFGVSAEDVVLAESEDGQLYFQRVVLRGGHSTYRLWLAKKDVTAPSFVNAWTPLQALGCSWEQGPVLAVDVPPSADIHRVYSLLEAGETAGIWDFEEGHCGHPLRR